MLILIQWRSVSLLRQFRKGGNFTNPEPRGHRNAWFILPYWSSNETVGEWLVRECSLLCTSHLSIFFALPVPPKNSRVAKPPRGACCRPVAGCTWIERRRGLSWLFFLRHRREPCGRTAPWGGRGGLRVRGGMRACWHRRIGRNCCWSMSSANLAISTWITARLVCSWWSPQFIQTRGVALWVDLCFPWQTMTYAALIKDLLWIWRWLAKRRRSVVLKGPFLLKFQVVGGVPLWRSWSLTNYPFSVVCCWGALSLSAPLWALVVGLLWDLPEGPVLGKGCPIVWRTRCLLLRCVRCGAGGRATVILRFIGRGPTHWNLPPSPPVTIWCRKDCLPPRGPISHPLVKMDDYFSIRFYRDGPGTYLDLSLHRSNCRSCLRRRPWWFVRWAIWIWVLCRCRACSSIFWWSSLRPPPCAG